MEKVISAASGSRKKQLSSFSFLSETERRHLVQDFNNTSAAYASNATIVELVEEQAQATPHNVAIRSEGQQLTYGELLRLANGFAAVLQKKYGVKQGDLVGLLLDRELLLLPVILGILKAGAAYLPIDPKYPQGRIESVIEDAGLKLLLTKNKYEEALKFVKADVCDIDTLAGEISTMSAPVPVQAKATDLAYVIYTSGSTGRPKGVMITHRSLVNYISWAAACYVGSAQATFPLYSSLSFDLTVTSLFTPLITGNAVVMYKEESAEVLIEKVLTDNLCDVIKLTPSHLKILRDSEAVNKMAGSKDLVFIVGGEELETQLAKDIYIKFKGRVHIYNEYGPTEATVGCMIYKYSPEHDTANSVPVGVPIHNTQIYLLDQFLEPVPKGVMGEMYIGGDGLATGYWQQQAMTAQKFIENPFIPGARMYKTGDYGKRLSNGNIIYLGRVDEQVKINGFRIEPGEIENSLLTYESINNAVVIAKEQGDSKQLVAYYTAPAAIDTAVLKSHLARALPVYMVPVHYVHLPAMPLTANGKLDKKALPDPELHAVETYMAPANETEAALQDIWSKVLKIEKEEISVTKSFLELGGHSIKVILMLNKVLKELQVKVPVNEVFNHPDIRSLAGYISRINTAGTNVVIEKAAPAASYPLASAQQRLFFLYEMDHASLAYNMPRVVQLEGNTDKQRLEEAFHKLIQRHESLRTSFEMEHNKPVQKIAAEVPFALEVYATNIPAEADAIIKSFIRPFNLAQAPLFRAGVIETAPGTSVLMMDMHHIITDGVSEEVLTGDFMKLYNQEVLPELRLQYKDYAVWTQSEEQQKLLQQQRNFWLHEFSESPAALDLPADFSRPVMKNYSGGSVRFALDAAETAAVKKLAEQKQVTVFVLLLAAYNILLGKLSNQQDVVIGTPVAGRQHADLEKMIGIFINMLAIRNTADEQLTFSQFLENVQSKWIHCFNNQGYPYEALIEELQLQRNTSRNPLYDVMFAYQNFDSQALSIPGLTVTPYGHEQRVAKFDLSLEAFEADGRLLFHFEYASALFKKETVERFAACFIQVIRTITGNSDKRIADISLVDASERLRLVKAFNNTAGRYPGMETMVSLFERQVHANPEKTAVVYEGKALTYAELNAAANRIARYLRKKYQVKADDVIGVMCDRSEQMLVCLLGVLKAGAAYLPLDPSYPADRISYILADSGAAVLLANHPVPERVSFTGAVVTPEAAAEEDAVDLAHNFSSRSLCYVIYTSGSTGNPKGVMINHYNVVNFITAMSNQLPVAEDDCMLAVTSTSFDISVLELFWTLCSGIQVVLHPADISLSALDRYVETEKQAVDFSLFFFSSYNNQETDKYKLLTESVKYVDEAGFKAVWTPERHFHEFGGLYPNPSVMSAALAMITKNVELRSGSIVSALHDPVRITEEWSVVDNLSNGRAALSFASGWNPDDFILAKDAYGNRQQLMYDNIRTVQQLWQGNAIRRVNGAGQETDIRIFPRPVQKELPLWITSSGNLETVKSAGAMGANLLTHLLGQEIDDLAAKIKIYREELAANGYDPGKYKVAVMLHTYIGEDVNTIEQIVEQPFTDYLKSALGLNRLLREEAGLNGENVTEEQMAMVLKNAFKRYYQNSSLIGTKSKCSEMVMKLKEIGVDEIACLVDFGIEQQQVMQGLTHLKTLKSLFSGNSHNTSKPITMMQSTPSFMRLVQEGTGSARFLQSLRVLLLGGENVPLALVNKLQRNTTATIYNMYGPTETTIWSCMHRFDTGTQKITVGKPILNTQVYILDNQLKPVPVGVAGNLYIAGDGVARGYWKRPELTAERFIANPFDAGALMYNTGDLARWNDDGTVELIGRNDTQVKINGYRIELGEIEKLLATYPGLKETAVVVSDNNGEKSLAAYYVADKNIEPAVLRAFLGTRLPVYMVPAFWVQLDKMPLTPNGKLDRKKLPDPTDIAEEDYVPPSSDHEARLVAIWAEVLDMHKDKISVTRSFFELGGNSLKILRLHTLIKERFEKEISIPEMFRYSTIASQVNFLNGSGADTEAYKADAATEVSEMRNLFTVLAGN